MRPGYGDNAPQSRSADAAVQTTRLFHTPRVYSSSSMAAVREVKEGGALLPGNPEPLGGR